VTLAPADTTAESALVFAADDAYAMPLAVALHSVLAHLDPGCRPELYVIDIGLSSASRARVLKVARAARDDATVTWLPVPTETLAGLPSGPDRSTRAAQAAYSRLLVPQLLPPQIRRAVYLDIDLLVRGDVSQLFTISLGGAAVGATRDFLIHTTDDEMAGVSGRRAGQPYYNAGVLVIDIPSWTSAKLTERTLDFARANTAQTWLDQDALNGVVDDWHDLGPEWNLQVGAFRASCFPPSSVPLQGRYGNPKRLYSSALVIHFTGVNPWDSRCNSRGTAAWVWYLIRLRWHSPAQAVRWTVHWLGERGVYGLFAKSHRFWRALQHLTQPRGGDSH